MKYYFLRSKLWLSNSVSDDRDQGVEDGGTENTATANWYANERPYANEGWALTEEDSEATMRQQRVRQQRDARPRNYINMPVFYHQQ